MSSPRFRCLRAPGCGSPALRSIAAILAINLIGIFMDYGAFRSEQYDIRAPMVGRDYYSQPAYVFVARREVRKHVLIALGARTEFRTFP